MLLDHLGHSETGAAILTTIETVLAPPDLGGTANTVVCGKAIADAIAG